MAEADQKSKQDQITGAQDDIRRIDAPTFYASSFRGGFAGNDLNIVFQSPTPGVLVLPDGSPSTVATLDPVFIVNMSAASAKDLLLLLQEQVSAYEKKFGVIRTDFTDTRAAAKAEREQKPKKAAPARRALKL